MTARAKGNNTKQFSYDYDNRLVKITYSDGSVIEYGYDGIGRRAWRKEGNTMRSFFYDGNRIIAEREGSSWVVRYLAALKPCGFVANGAIRIYHADRLGSVRFVTDANQNILVSYIYEGFGKVIAQNGGGGGPYQFCGLWGYRNDHDAGLLHVGARYYEPEIGRFVQKDPIFGDVMNPQTLNYYSYAINNPVNFIDPSGRVVGCLIIGLAIGVTIGFFIYWGIKKIKEGIERQEREGGEDVERVYEKWKKVGES